MDTTPSPRVLPSFSRRALLTTLAVGGVTTAAVPLAAPALAAGPFVDVTRRNQFAEEISYMYEEGISTGWVIRGKRYYKPLDSVRRDAMAAFFFRLFGDQNYKAPTKSPFRDVKTSRQFYREIAWMKDSGISTGWKTPRGAEYRPLEPIRRDAMAAFLYRAAGSPSTKNLGITFKDVPIRSQFSKEIRWLASTGISRGWPDDTFRPRQTVKRDAMAAFLHRFITYGYAWDPDRVFTTTYGTAYKWPDGVSITISAPKRFTPSDWAFGGEGFPYAVRVSITVANSSRKVFDPSEIYLTATSGGREAESIFDSDNGLTGSPMSSVMPGRSVTWEEGFGVMRTSDVKIQAENLTDFEFSQVVFR